MPFSSSTRARIIAGASWTLLMIGLCAVGGKDAKADCAQDSRHRAAIDLGDPFAEGAGRQDAAPKAPKPCNGPSCSGNPATPTTSAPATTVDVEARATLAAPEPPAVPPSAGRPDDPAIVRPIHAGSAIFHPPRLPA
ncbi:hypothetical protein TA3x_000060 [Tundrisphaera sp. TA3]|uniref:hypothetical protein n=1 Tax=Tundrisphaera sp. TA3 TaxID=3435775 RepID=UPI003EBD3D0A